MGTPKDPQKEYVLRAFAMLLGLVGLLINLIYFNIFLYRSVGLLMLIAAGFLIKKSNLRRSRSIGVIDVPQVRTGPGLMAWLVSAATTVAAGFFYFCMVQDQRAGGHYVWPAYAFAASALIVAIGWGYIFAKFS